MAFRDNNTNTVILDEKTAYAFNTDQPTGTVVSTAESTNYVGNNTTYGGTEVKMDYNAGQIIQGSPDYSLSRGGANLSSVLTIPNTSDEELFYDGTQAANTRMSESVAIGHNLIVLGAPQDDTAGTNRGAVHVYDQSLPGLNAAATKFVLTADDGADGDAFGSDVAVGNGRIVIGANYSDASGTDSGAAYIYTLGGNLIKKIIPTDSAQQDYLGTSCAVGNGRIVIGAYGNDDNGLTSGSAYIYDLYGNNEIKINAPDGAAGDSFGKSVAIGNGRIVVGAPLADSGSNSNAGAAYVYDLLGNYLFKLTGSGTTEHFFGTDVAVGAGHIIVGEPGNNSIWRIFDASTGSLLESQQIIYSFSTPLPDLGHRVAIGQGVAVFGSTLNTDYGWYATLSLNHNTVHYLDLLNETAL
jgi:hypothetical protein